MLILHHYDFSNYSEKIRLVLGLKGLEWHSVKIPAIAPKPDYTPLTAGYRRTPALQIGADVYCDTRLIAEVLEALAPSPSLWPEDAASRALGEMLVQWAEAALMRPAALYITGLHAARFPAAFHADRAALHGKPTPGVAQVQASARGYRSQVAIQLGVLEALLADGRQWAIGERPGLADFALYEAPWFLRTIGGEQALAADLVHMRAWLQRVAEIGHGVVRAMTAAQALEAARAAQPLPLVDPAPSSDEGVNPGDEVVVKPFGEASVARGRLCGLDDARITIASESDATGCVHVHFPRLGYRLSRARG